jgi:hypothetical protein
MTNLRVAVKQKTYRGGGIVSRTVVNNADHDGHASLSERLGPIRQDPRYRSLLVVYRDDNPKVYRARWQGMESQAGMKVIVLWTSGTTDQK